MHSFLRHVQLKPVCSAAVTMQMAELHVWFDKHTGRCLCRTVQSAGWAAGIWTTLQYIGWCLESDDHSDSEGPLVLNFESHNKISTDSYSRTLHNQVYQDHGTNVQVYWPMASSCCMKTPILLCSAECRTSWMSCDERCSNILDFLPCDFHMPLTKAFKSCSFTSVICRRLYYSGLGSSPRHYLQMVYMYLCIKQTAI